MASGALPGFLDLLHHSNSDVPEWRTSPFGTSRCLEPENGQENEETDLCPRDRVQILQKKLAGAKQQCDAPQEVESLEQ